MPHTFTGEFAALGTAVCWTGSALFFSAAAHRIGSLTLNQVRLFMAFAFLALYGWLTRGYAVPGDATPEAWGWLALSGFIGFTLGDLCLFRSYLLVGPRLSMLVMSLWPPLAALCGWLLLGETLRAQDWLGMALTLSGVAWVVLERQPEAGEQSSLRRFQGIALAFGGAVGQALGLVLGKFGMGEYDPFAATQIRVVAGIAGFAVLFLCIGWWPRVWESLSDGRGMLYSLGGSFFGPFLGVGLSLLAVQHTATGIASTIMALVPVLIIPCTVLLHKEKVSLRAFAGAMLAVGGTALLFLSPAHG
ncbi:MAG: DMT family transporter [Planctomycetota bacterium]|nr:DMT family transporter [Planctomycetota bacterium]